MLEVRTFGDAASQVVILHGSPTRPGHGEPLAKRLSARHTVHVLSLPGYGNSPALERVTLEAIQDAIAEAIKDRTAALIGFSGGAYHAFALATRGLLKPRAIVSLGGVVNIPEESRPMFHQFAAMLRSPMDTRGIMPQRMLSEEGQRDPANVAEVESWIEAISRENLARELEAFADAPDLRPALSQLDVPVLVRAGTLDVASPPANNEAIARHCKHATLELVEGKGHALLLEDLEATAASIERALS
jgi:pimeloyl-ACP methyl ester carboxylesterase